MMAEYVVNELLCYVKHKFDPINDIDLRLVVNTINEFYSPTIIDESKSLLIKLCNSNISTVSNLTKHFTSRRDPNKSFKDCTEIVNII